MDIAVGALGPLLPKLGELLVGEFTLENRVRKRIESLLTELTLMHAALRKVAKVPPDQLDEGVKIWAGKVKELAYQMEDIIDAFMVRVEDGDEPAKPKNIVKKLVKKTVKLFKKGKDLHGISDALAEVVGQAKELAEQRQRYEQEMPDTGAGVSVDPRVIALYTDVTELVGIEESRDDVINMLLKGDNWSEQPLKTVSIVGFGGLGKTTLAKAAYDNIKLQFDCDAFVSVSQNPDTKKVLKNILYALDKAKYADIHNAWREENHLVDELIEFLTNKRYLIVIDDIWDEKAWQLIKCAFSKKSPGSRLITTTRIVSVSEVCCSSVNDIYRMKPLSHDVSRSLFNKRVFSHEEGCPPELVQVSEDILRKCGGIPLAIITIASLLASNRHIKSKDQWYVLLNSIGHGLTEDRNTEEMRKILLFSYYDLPSYLKPCLLYLSIYPEDHKIMRAKLIWKWISEGLVHSERRDTSLYGLADSYFNELVNRSLIQPVGIDDEEKVEACRVHDMVLDLICSLASEENFVNILDDTDRKMLSSQSKVRRISIQNSKVDLANTRMAQVRSLTIFRMDNVGRVLNMSSFQVLRVLDLEGCDVLDIGYVENLLHLRYLALKGTSVKELPVEIGNLQFLQALDLEKTQIKELPSSIVRLRRMMYLSIPEGARLPCGIGSMSSLEVLRGLLVGSLSSENLNIHVVKELGLRIKLRVLEFVWGELGESLDEAVVEFLNNLHKLETLYINARSERVDLMREGWVPPLHLSSLQFSGAFNFCTLPAWINPSSLPLLSSLSIGSNEVRSEDIQMIGMLPALRCLWLYGPNTSGEMDVLEKFVVTSDSFPCATECNFCFVAAVPSIFPRGAAPRLKRLRFDFPTMWIRRGDFDFGMGHLPSLETIVIDLIDSKGLDSEVNEAKTAWRAAAKDHPNCPKIDVNEL